MSRHKARVLIIAGSDSGGGAGIQADIKTVTALGGYAATAVTAITVQNTKGVSGIHPIPLDIVEGQARAVLEDIGADVIKTGMLASAGLIDCVASLLADHSDIPLVLDPVMVATSGDRLIEEKAVEAVREKLLPRATLVTPNAPEAEKLTGLSVKTPDDQRKAGQALLAAGAGAALVKGGHLAGTVINDVLVTPDITMVFESARQDTPHTHGTGCTLASGIATGLAKGQPLADAVEAAGAYLAEAIRRAPGLGSGHGPVNHAWVVQR